MSATKVVCPRCHTALKSAKRLRGRKSVVCPLCGAPFEVAPDHEPTAPGLGPASFPPPPLVRAAALPPAPALAGAGISARRLAATLGLAGVYAGVGLWLALYCWAANRTLPAPFAEPAPAPAASPAEPGPAPERQMIVLPRAEQVAVNEAINRGVRFLKTSQLAGGSWAGDTDYVYPLGQAALPGLTLLECGVPPGDPNIQKAADYVRTEIGSSTKTYELSLAVLFLDRVGERADNELIQALALRLVAGQLASGGWSYDCPTLSPREHKDLLLALQASRPHSPAELSGWLKLYERGAGEFGEDGNPEPEALPPFPAPPAAAVAAKLKRVAVLMTPAELARKSPEDEEADNSNTQFALLALWAARRHDVPVERAVALIVRRFRTTQRADGSWTYRPNKFVSRFPTMTCAGLLGLAVGQGLANEAQPGPRRPAEDPAVRKALGVIGPFIGRAREPTLHPPRPGDKRPPITNLYFLWSLERVGVLFNLPTIAEKDWYRWGAEMLLATQDHAKGSWHGGGSPGSSHSVDTCFALLFLRQANLARDLTSKLQLLSK